MLKYIKRYQKIIASIFKNCNDKRELSLNNGLRKSGSLATSIAGNQVKPCLSGWGEPVICFQKAVDLSDRVMYNAAHEE